MKTSLKVVLLFLISSVILAQGSAGTDAKFEYRALIDMPSAGILERGYAGVSVDVLPLGVVISKIEVGVFDNFSFGISYGGANIIGTGEVDWYELPGVNARLRVMDETVSTPAVTIGFDSQGKGAYLEDLDRFEIKSPGFFVAVAKNFEFMGYFSIHGIINYSLERQDGDKDINLGVGFEKTLGGNVSFVGEWDFANNDNTGNSVGKGSGYLNLGLRWSVGEGFTIGMDLRNLFNNKKFNRNNADRALFVEYVSAIF